MKLSIIDFLFGVCRMQARGTFCERIINIAGTKNIFLRDINRTDDNSITFKVSRKGAQILLSENLPGDVSLKILTSSGLPYIFSSNKNRVIALTAPLIVFILLFLSTQVIWHVNIIDADSETEAFLLKELKKLGVRKGAFKFSIDQSDVKNRMLIENPELLWLWVDIRGSSAIVKFANRTLPPAVYTEEEFYNIYSTRDAVITRIMPKSGIAKVRVGDTVLKGQMLIEGIMPRDAETTKFIHASGEVFGNVWEEKIVTIPKKKEIRTPTGEKIEHLSINFKNFQLKLFINSSILYPEYDMIENNRVFIPFGATFTKKEYIEVDVTYEDNNIPLMQKAYETEFYKSLTDKGFSVNYTESIINDSDKAVTLTMRALCEEPIAVERRMNFGEDNSITDS